MTTQPASIAEGVLLSGAEAIRTFLGLATRRQVYHYAHAHGLPVFHIGRSLCAKPAALREWLEHQQRAGRPE